MSVDMEDVTTLLNHPYAAITEITPAMARRWLDHNRVNRPARNKRVLRYAADMAAGNWQLTGEAIKFDNAGNLIDGQHRLMAIVDSDVTVTMFVVRGLANDAQVVLDSGGARTASDNLAMAGYENATLVASIARRRISMHNFGNVTNAAVHQYVSENPEIKWAARIARRHAKNTDIVPSTVGLAAWAIAEVRGWEVAEEFFSAAASKVGLSAGDPVLAMTNYFADARRTRRQIPLEAQMSIIIRAFNYRTEGKVWRQVKATGSNGATIQIPPVSA